MTVSLTQQEIEQITQTIQPEHLQNIETMVLFLGHAHSGHSVIGAIMDCHPEVSISNEANVAKLLLDHPLNKNQLESVLLYLSQNNAKSNSWHNTEYKYKIDNSFQGQTEAPQVIGDKKGGGTTRVLMKNPHLLDQLLDMYGDRIKFINVRRNPIDVVAAYAYYWEETIGPQHVERFIENDQANLDLQKRIQTANWLTIDQAEFTQNPTQIMGSIFDFIGVKYSNEQLKDWTRHVRSDIAGRSQKMDIPEFIIDQLNTYKKNRLNSEE